MMALNLRLAAYAATALLALISAAPVADGDEDLVFSLVQLCASATGKPLTDDELRLITGYPRQLALLFPGQLTQAS
jgi:hypothetical protein